MKFKILKYTSFLIVLIFISQTYISATAENLSFLEEIEKQNIQNVEIDQPYENESVEPHINIDNADIFDVVNESESNTYNYNETSNINKVSDLTPGYVSKTLYLVENFDHLSKVGLNRGNNHDRQHLGIYVKANSSIRIRQKNLNYKKDLSLSFYNNDRSKVTEGNIPKSGNWVYINSPSVDSVPFIKTHVKDANNFNNEFPEIEYEINENTFDLPVYNLGDGIQKQTEFFEKWSNTNAPYAVYDSSAITMLVPKKNFNSNAFANNSLDTLLQFYVDMMDQYDRFAGLSYTTDNPLDKNINAKYFLLANVNGGGAAYYAGDHIGQNGDNIEGYLQNGWLPLHEVGHGYQGSFSNRIPIGEVWNNIYAHYFQHNGKYPNGGDWLKINSSRENIEARREFGYSNVGYKEKLYFWVNMLDTIGAEKSMSYFNRTYRALVASGEADKYKGADLFVKLFSDSSGYNLAPYFESWGLKVTDEMKLYLSEQKKYPVLYPIKYIVDHYQSAEIIRKKHGLVSIYSMISIDTLYEDAIDLNLNGNITLNIDSTDAIFDELYKKEYVEIYRSGKLVSKKLIDSKTLLLDNLPVGVYEIRMPNIHSRLADFSEYLYAVVGNNKTISLNSIYVEKIYGNITSDYEFDFLGLGNVPYAKAIYDLDRKTMTVSTYNTQPHSYFSDAYSTITVKDTEGNVVYNKVHIGNISSPEDKTFKIDIGYTIDITHREAESRFRIESKEIFGHPSIRFNNKTISMKLDKFGLNITQGSNSVGGSYELYKARLDDYIFNFYDIVSDEDIIDSKKYIKEKNNIQVSLSNLPESFRESILKKYPNLNNFIDYSYLNEYKINFLGMDDVLFAEGKYDAVNKKFIFESYRKKPHNFYISTIYSTITIKDELGKVIFNEIYISDQYINAKRLEFDLSIGHTIEIEHLELDKRLQIDSISQLGKKENVKNISNNKIKLNVTNRGLKIN